MHVNSGNGKLTLGLFFTHSVHLGLQHICACTHRKRKTNGSFSNTTTCACRCRKRKTNTTFSTSPGHRYIGPVHVDPGNGKLAFLFALSVYITTQIGKTCQLKTRVYHHASVYEHTADVCVWKKNLTKCHPQHTHTVTISLSNSCKLVFL